MATETRTVTYTVYCINDEEYRSLYSLRKAHKELIFSNKADEELLKGIGITIEQREKTVEYEVPDETESETIEGEVTEEVVEEGASETNTESES